MGGGGSGADRMKGRQSGGLLQHFDAMERVVLTANGNLQRVIRYVRLDIVSSRTLRPWHGFC